MLAVAFSVWTELMVRVRVRVRVAIYAAVAFSVWTEVTICADGWNEHPRGKSLSTHMLASSEQAWGTIGIFGRRFLSKKRTVQ
jgi:hypothetical protein